MPVAFLVFWGEGQNRENGMLELRGNIFMESIDQKEEVLRCNYR